MIATTEASLSTSKAYRWVVLIVSSFAMMMMNALQFQIAGLATRIIPELNLQPSQFAMVLSAPMLTAAIFGILAGVLADRFGVKNAIAAGLVLATIGSFGRINANSFAGLFAWSLCIGFGLAFINSNGAKVLGAWFPREQMGTAMGIFLANTGLGIAIGQGTSALFTTTSAAFTTSAFITLCSLVAWMVFAKSAPAGGPDFQPQPVKEYLRVVVKSRNIWIAAIALMFAMGSWVAHTGNLPFALTQAKGISPVLAGLAASSLSLALIAGTIIGPLCADKIGLIKPFLGPTALLAAVCSYFAWIVPFGPSTWILLIVTGVLLGASIPIVMSLPILLPEVGPVYAGCAGGVLSTFQLAGGFFIPSYIIMRIAGENSTQMFLCISAGYLICGAIYILLPELGSKARRKGKS